MPQPRDHSAEANAARSEDLRWMAEHHETPREAARRLGISADSLRTWCRRHDPEVLELLDANQQRRIRGAA